MSSRVTARSRNKEKNFIDASLIIVVIYKKAVLANWFQNLPASLHPIP
jgi:hypothetical protein